MKKQICVQAYIYLRENENNFGVDQNVAEETGEIGKIRYTSTFSESGTGNTDSVNYREIYFWRFRFCSLFPVTADVISGVIRLNWDDATEPRVSGSLSIPLEGNFTLTLSELSLLSVGLLSSLRHSSSLRSAFCTPTEKKTTHVERCVCVCVSLCLYLCPCTQGSSCTGERAPKGWAQRLFPFCKRPFDLFNVIFSTPFIF